MRKVHQVRGLLFKYIKPLWLSLLFLALLMAGSVGLQLTAPQILRYFIDSALSQKPLYELLTAVFLYFLAASVQKIVAVATTYLCQRIGWQATNALRRDLILHYMNLDMDFHNNRQGGEMIERLDGDVNRLFEFFSTLFLNIAGNLLIIAGVIAVLFRESWLISLAFGVFSVIAIAVLRKAQNIGTGLWVRSAGADAGFNGFLKEQIDNVVVVRSLGVTGSVMRRFCVAVKNLYAQTLAANMVYPVLWSLSTVIFAASTVLSLGMGTWLWQKGVITFGTIYLLFSYSELMCDPIMQLRDNLGELQRAEASVLRVAEILDTKPEIVYGCEQVPEAETLRLDVRNVFFSYAADDAVLKNISFSLTAGKSLGIIGRTGCGKTTLVKLVARLYDPSAGEILLNGKNIAAVTDESLRKNVAYLAQDVHLFHGTIRENITFYDKTVSDSAIYEAISELELGDWLAAMPNGLDTTLDFAGGSVSAGEAQLLSLIRVFIQNPALVIFDESSAKLDPCTEKCVNAALGRFLSQRAAIIIAHRLPTLEKADDIMIIRDGEVAEYGSRSELASNRGSLYSTLLQKGIEEVLV